MSYIFEVFPMTRCGQRSSDVRGPSGSVTRAAHRVLCAGLMALLLGAAACGQGDGGGETGGLVLVAASETLALPPGAPAQVDFRLSDLQGRARPNRTLTFALVEEESSGAGGALLETPVGLTDTQGTFSARLRAGAAARFLLRARHGSDLEATVTVTVAPVTTANAQAFVVSQPGQTPASLELRLYEGGDCDQLGPDAPPPEDPLYVARIPAAGTWRLPPLTRRGQYAVLARGLDQSGALFAFGCVTFDGASLLQSALVNIPVPMGLAAPVLTGRYELASELAFAPAPPAGAVAVAEAWAGLSRCPQDPAQLWLDCTLDALGGPSTRDDPLDCQVGPDEGPLGAQLAARRGLALPDKPACRGLEDEGGLPSAEAMVRALFPVPPSPLAPRVAALAELGRKAAGLFDRIRLSSSLVFYRTGRDGELAFDHIVRSMGFPVGDGFYPLAAFDRPGRFSRFRRATVTEAGTRLELSRHGFGLRLGSAARRAFALRALIAGEWPEEERAFVDALASLADDGERKGCPALDARLCPELGQPEGCLLAACMQGLSGLTARLTAGFEALDGDDLDLFMEGAATLLDRSPDGTVRALGSLKLERGGPGLWTGESRGAEGTSNLTGLWIGVRAPGS